MSGLLLWAWLAALDAGSALPTPPSAEDAAVLENLELLEHLDEATDYELLHELSVEPEEKK